ncbi:unnamed protein product [Gadus morhua 'NCC']
MTTFISTLKKAVQVFISRPAAQEGLAPQTFGFYLPTFWPPCGQSTSFRQFIQSSLPAGCRSLSDVLYTEDPLGGPQPAPQGDLILLASAASSSGTRPGAAPFSPEARRRYAHRLSAVGVVLCPSGPLGPHRGDITGIKHVQYLGSNLL